MSASHPDTQTATDILTGLMRIPRTSRAEDASASYLAEQMQRMGIEAHRHKNNVWAVSDNFDAARPTLILCSHHDTVSPSQSYTFDPYSPFIDAQGRLYGLGSNDAGASAIGMLLTFNALRSAPLSYNLLLALVAEEEVSGVDGVRSLLSSLAQEHGIHPAMGIVGEPTSLNAAIGERGLVVLDGIAKGTGGHAARHEGPNALYMAIDDITRLRNYTFPHQSPLLGDVRVTVTQINAGGLHNVVPDECRYTVDVRTTDAFSNDEVVRLLQKAVHDSTLTPRSTRIHASSIDTSHPLVRAAVASGAETFVSPTTSDMSAMDSFPTIKLGIGDSNRSHTPDEYVIIDEIASGLTRYHKLLASLNNILTTSAETNS